MTRCCDPLHCAPPQTLERISRNGSEEQWTWALRALQRGPVGMGRSVVRRGERLS